MASLLTCKTYPSDNLDRPIKSMQTSPKKTLPKIEELEPPSVQAVEDTFECQKIKPTENARSRYTFSGNVGGLKIEENDFPSIDNSESEGKKQIIHAKGIRSQSGSKVDLNVAGTDEKAKEWKREKTYDGCPIYRVNFHFMFLFIKKFFSMLKIY